MIYENYPMYDIDVEKGTIFSLRYKRIVGRKCGVVNKPYLGVTINSKTKLIHRIIWECVNGEIPEGYDIHHIDGNPMNNSIYNLQMIDAFEHNSMHKIGNKYCIGRKGIPTMLGKHHTDETKKLMSDLKPKKKIVQYTLDGEFVKVWNSINEPKKDGFTPGNISKCCKGKVKQHKGFIWRYKEEKDVA